MGIDECANGKVGDLLELGTHLAAAVHLLTRIDDNHAVVPYDHGVGRYLVADRGIDILGDLDDVRLEHPVALKQALGCFALLGRGTGEPKQHGGCHTDQESHSHSFPSYFRSGCNSTRTG